MISAEEIPEHVRDAALEAAPGLVITEAEKEDGVYCVHGTVDGVFTEVEVTAAGEVLEVETGEDDDDDEAEEGAAFEPGGRPARLFRGSPFFLSPKGARACPSGLRPWGAPGPTEPGTR